MSDLIDTPQPTRHAAPSTSPTTNTSLPSLRAAFPRLFAQPEAAGPPSITVQCAARGEPVPAGAIAGDLRARGFDIPSDIDDTETLVEADEGSKVYLGHLDAPTGYAWRPTMTVADVVVDSTPERVRTLSPLAIERRYVNLADVLKEMLSKHIADAEEAQTLTALLVLADEARRRERELAMADETEPPAGAPEDDARGAHPSNPSPVTGKVLDALRRARHRATVFLVSHPQEGNTAPVYTIGAEFRTTDLPAWVRRLACGGAAVRAEIDVSHAEVKRATLPEILRIDGPYMLTVFVRIAGSLTSTALN